VVVDIVTLVEASLAVVRTAVADGLFDVAATEAATAVLREKVEASMTRSVSPRPRNQR
jgi:hypothetical protein